MGGVILLSFHYTPSGIIVSPVASRLRAVTDGNDGRDEQFLRSSGVRARTGPVCPSYPPKESINAKR